MEASPRSFGVLVKMQPNSSKAHAFTRVLSDHFISKEKLKVTIAPKIHGSRDQGENDLFQCHFEQWIYQKIKWNLAMTGSRRMVMPSGLFN